MNLFSKTITATLIVTALLSNGACSKKVAFQNSPVVPAARGDVKVTRDKNNNYVIKIQLDNLAEVKRLQTAKDIYLVWMTTDQDSTKNIGQLISKTGFMSNKLNASFETVSPFKPKRIFITAETNPNAQVPGDQIVLSTTQF